MVANIDGDHMPEGDDIYLREMTYNLRRSPIPDGDDIYLTEMTYT